MSNPRRPHRQRYRGGAEDAPKGVRWIPVGVLDWKTGTWDVEGWESGLDTSSPPHPGGKGRLLIIAAIKSELGWAFFALPGGED